MQPLVFTFLTSTANNRRHIDSYDYFHCLPLPNRSLHHYLPGPASTALDTAVPTHGAGGGTRRSDGGNGGGSSGVYIRAPVRTISIVNGGSARAVSDSGASALPSIDATLASTIHTNTTTDTSTDTTTNTRSPTVTITQITTNIAHTTITAAPIGVHAPAQRLHLHGGERGGGAGEVAHLLRRQTQQPLREAAARDAIPEWSGEME